MTDKPNPGSREAIAAGCTCPVLDNAHGKGYMGVAGTYVYRLGCPVHRPAPGQTADADDGPCPEGEHRWVERRVGGPPDEAYSAERVRYCERCGTEDAGDD